MKYKYSKNNKNSKKVLFYLVLSVFCLSCVGFCLTFFVKGSQYQLDNFTETGNISENLNKNKNISEIKLNNNNKFKKISKSEVLNYDFSEWNREHPDLIVINNKNALPSDFKIETVTFGDKKIGKCMFESLKKMFNDALKDGCKMYVVSGYRSIELQTKLFNNQISNEMKNNEITKEQAAEIASRSVARPRHSEHNAGLAVDINSTNIDFAGSRTYEWLEKNAYKYGFIVRYPYRSKDETGEENKSIDETGVIFEPWHIRYVGKNYAKEIYNSKKTLERYIIEEEIPKNLSR